MVREYKRTYRHVRQGKNFLPYVSYSIKDLENAVREVREGQSSVRKVATKYNIPKSTLARKCKNGTIYESAGHPTLFNATEENAFLTYCEVLGEWGFPLDAFDLRILAQKYLNRIGRTVHILKDNLPGRDWALSFMKRHKNRLSHKFATNISTERAKVSPETIDAFFENYVTTVSGVSPENIVNFDETNLCDDPGAKKYVFKRGTKYPERVVNNSKTAVSLMFTGTADGQMLPIYVVYKAERVWQPWVEGGPPDTRYNRSKSGWFDTTCFEDWFETVIVPFAKNKPGKKVIIGDNLSSHFSEKILQSCESLNISFVCLPPKSTHLMQPLDVAFYGPLKKYWKNILTSWKTTADGRKYKTMAKSCFPKLLAQLCDLMIEKGVISANLKAGFEKSGLFPVNPERPKSRLPRALVAAAEVHVTTSEVVIDILQDMRGYKDTAPSKRRKRCDVEPGKSISAKDLTPKPTMSSKGKGQGKKTKTDANKENISSSQNINKKRNQAKSRQKKAKRDLDESTSVSDNFSEHSDSDLMDLDLRKMYDSDHTSCSEEQAFLISYLNNRAISEEPVPGASGESSRCRTVKSRPEPSKNTLANHEEELILGSNEKTERSRNVTPMTNPNEEELAQKPGPGSNLESVQHSYDELAKNCEEEIIPCPIAQDFNEQPALGPIKQPVTESNEELADDSTKNLALGPNEGPRETDLYQNLYIYNVNDKVLVRYYIKKSWKYYVGVIENIENHFYTILFFKTVRQNNSDIIFMKTKRVDRDVLPPDSLVKNIDIEQISSKPEKYLLCNEDDKIYFD